MAALLFALTLLLAVDSTRVAISLSDVERTMADLNAALARDRGALWGVPLDGPLLFVDPTTREVVATAADSAGVLRREGAFFRGRLPAEVNVANTALDWSGKRWSMVMWPLPSDDVSRRVLLLHELWHRIQDRLSLPATGPANAHLDTRDGRLWIQLEWRALRVALERTGRERGEALADALAFRAERRRLFASAAAEERALECHEGLAEYTGVRLAISDAEARRARARAKLDSSAELATFVRSFAYLSGPAYGLLLDEFLPDWRRKLGTDADLGELLRAAAQVPVREARALEARAALYGAPALREAEDARERARQARLATLRRDFIDGPVLRIPLTKPQLSFDPRGLQPLDSAGTVYAGLRIVESWGVLEAKGGGLVSADWRSVTVPAAGLTVADTLRGQGWFLSPAPGWRAIPAARAGSWRLAPTSGGR